MAPGFAFASSTNSVKVRTPSDGATLTSVGAQAVATAPADGYTVLLANSDHAILGTER